jgi:hypothetical protein
VIDITTDGNATLREGADWVRLMRSADSLLATFTDEEITVGLLALDDLAAQQCAPGTLELLVLGREGI